MKYSQEVKDFIKENVVGRTVKELTQLVNDTFDIGMTESKMKSYKTNNKLRSYTSHGGPTGRPTEKYPEEIFNYIFENYKGKGPTLMAETLNKKFGTNYTKKELKSFYGNRKLDSGLKGYFHPGNIPFNKGLKGRRVSRATEFKKGNRPSNWVPVGSERINTDGYIDIKIQDGHGHRNWKAKHKILWEKENGPIPEGHVLVFADQNKLNVDLDNIILVSKRELFYMNQNKLVSDKAELTKTGHTLAKVMVKSRDISKAANS